MKKHKVARRTAVAAIRGSVPDGKLRATRIILSDASQGVNPIGGFTQYDRAQGGAVVQLGAPAGDSAYDITVRGHETAHATHDKPPRKKKESVNEFNARQVVGDVINESRELPNVGLELLTAYNRAHIATVLKGDVRSILAKRRQVLRGDIPDSVGVRNASVLAAVRAVGMLRSYGGLDSLYKYRSKGARIIREAIGDRMYKAVKQICDIAKYPRGRNKAISMLSALLEIEPPPEHEGRKGDFESDMLETLAGTSLDGHMAIVNLLPKSVYCCKEKQVSRRHAPSGVIINTARYVSAIVSGCADGLFSRRLKQKAGGCVVIDASGSMGATKANLSAICKLVPTATVGYYSGFGNNGRGELCVYASGGKRFNGELPVEHMHHGNCVDLPAVKWMMRYPRPWVLVSDLKFCGGVVGSEVIALALVERAEKRGLLKVCRSLEEAFEDFGGKGEMPS